MALTTATPSRWPVSAGWISSRTTSQDRLLKIRRGSCGASSPPLMPSSAARAPTSRPFSPPSSSPASGQAVDRSGAGRQRSGCHGSARQAMTSAGRCPLPQGSVGGTRTPWGWPAGRASLRSGWCARACPRSRPRESPRSAPWCTGAAGWRRPLRSCRSRRSCPVGDVAGDPARKRGDPLGIDADEVEEPIDEAQAALLLTNTLS